MLELEEASQGPQVTHPTPQLLAASCCTEPYISLRPGGPVYHPGPIRVGSEVTDLLSGLISSCVTWEGARHHKE